MMRFLATAAGFGLVVACASTPAPIAVTIDLDRSSDDPQPIEITVGGRDFAETIQLSEDEETAEVVVPGPGSYSFTTGGVIEACA